MELSPSSSKSKGENRAGSPQFRNVSHSIPSIIATHEHTHKNNSGQSCRKTYHDPSENADGYKRNDVLQYLPANHAACTGYGSEVCSTPLTAQALFEHDLERENVTHSQPQAKIFETTVAPPDRYILGLHRRDRGAFQSEPLYEDFPPCAQDQEKDTASMYNEADSDISNRQSDDHWQSRPFYEDHADGCHMDFHISEMSDADPLSWEIEPAIQSQDLILRGNVLAGIGESFANDSHQEYTIYCELIID